ncbi:MAG: hypothetical protein VKJ46_05610 [Leptolyngbyaceae bacterium]|nr:hypothetical protein [Leptolyngbyaceae bacterium]
MLQLTSELSDELLLEICEAADVIACECPGYLAQLLSQVRAFRSYTTSCIEQFPEDAETHRWLIQQAQQVEKLLLETIAELMRREDLLDEANYILLDKMSERARATALKQIGR